MFEKPSFYHSLFSCFLSVKIREQLNSSLSDFYDVSFFEILNGKSSLYQSNETQPSKRQVENQRFTIYYTYFHRLSKQVKSIVLVLFLYSSSLLLTVNYVIELLVSGNRPISTIDSILSANSNLNLMVDGFRKIFSTGTSITIDSGNSLRQYAAIKYIPQTTRINLANVTFLNALLVRLTDSTRIQMPIENRAKKQAIPIADLKNLIINQVSTGFLSISFALRSGLDLRSGVGFCREKTFGHLVQPVQLFLDQSLCYHTRKKKV